MAKSVIYRVKCPTFGTTYELVRILSQVENIIVSVEENYIPDKFGKGDIEYIVYFNFVNEGEE